MSKIFFVLIFTITLFGSGFWDYTYTYNTKKDELIKIKIKKDYLPTKKTEGKLVLRWTLYSGEKLVLLANYEGNKTQYLLEKSYKRDSVKIDLLDDYKNKMKKAFAIVKFIDFDTKKNVVKLEVKIHDPNKRLKVDFINE